MEIYEVLRHYLNREVAVFLTAWLPFIELRGAIPLAISLGITPLNAFLLGVAGNTLSVIPLLLLLNPVREFLIQNSRLMARFFDWLYERTIRKSDNVEKYGALGLILFTAVPLPTTGAWTASLAAIIFKIKFKYAFPAITMGVIIAGIAVTL
ncbi:MAG: COG2426 family protein, partial [Halanaerobiaceae bacterium]